MRVEHDAGGVSVFLESEISVLALAFSGLGLPGWVLVGIGLLQTLAGLAWAGPALVFVGIVLLISVPLTMEGHPDDVCDYVRIDHLGLKIGEHRFSSEATLQELEQGIRVVETHQSAYLPVRSPAMRSELLDLLQRALARTDGRETGSIPPTLQALLSRRS